MAISFLSRLKKLCSDVIQTNVSILPVTVEVFSASLCLYHSLSLLPLKRSPSVGPASKGRRVSTITAISDL